MEAIIFKYLDKKYITDCSSVGNYGVYLRHYAIEEFRMPHNGSALTREVSTVFGFDKDVSRTIIENWAIKHGANSLEFYWNYNSIELQFDEGPILPLATRVAASTIGRDLVRVQPMSAPSGKLFYFDTPSAVTTPKNYEISNDLCDAYVESLNKATRIKNIEDKWDSLGFLDGLTGKAKDSISHLYQNQVRFLLNEKTKPLE